MTRMLKRLISLGRSRDGSAGVEFGLVMPLAIVLSVGIIEFAVLGVHFSMTGEAVRRGTREAVIAPALADLSVLTVAGQKITCTGTTGGSVSCVGGVVDFANFATFGKVVAEMKVFDPKIVAENIELEYRYSSLGDPSLPNGVKPFVTVRLRNYKHSFIMAAIVPGVPNQVTLPDFAVTLMGQGSPVIQTP